LKADSQEGSADTLGVNALIQRYRQTREERYQEFLKLWSSLQKEDFRGNLLRIIKKKA